MHNVDGHRRQRHGDGEIRKKQRRREGQNPTIGSICLFDIRHRHVLATTIPTHANGRWKG